MGLPAYLIFSVGRPSLYRVKFVTRPSLSLLCLIIFISTREVECLNTHYLAKKEIFCTVKKDIK